MSAVGSGEPSLCILSDTLYSEVLWDLRVKLRCHKGGRWSSHRSQSCSCEQAQCCITPGTESHYVLASVYFKSHQCHLSEQLCLSFRGRLRRDWHEFRATEQVPCQSGVKDNTSNTYLNVSNISFPTNSLKLGRMNCTALKLRVPPDFGSVYL